MSKSINDLLNTQEDLNPELAQHLYPDGPLGPMIHHPLMIELVHCEQLNARYNRRLAYLKEEVKKAIKEKKWAKLIFLYEKPYRLTQFVTYMDQMTDQEYWRLLGEVWTNSENLFEYREIIPSLLSPKGKRENSSARMMMTGNDLKLFDSLPESEPITVYRGYQGKKNRQGYAWSLSEAKALWFARRFSPPIYHVDKGQTRKKDVLAVLNGRMEFEVIVDPKKVKGKARVMPLKRPEHLERVLDLAKKVFALPALASHHGPEHWETVEKNAIALCEKNKEADREICRLFAILHDCKRENENEDPLHGHRAAQFILDHSFAIPVQTEERLETLLEACRWHNDGRVSKDPTIGTCWDADRLDLPRVGIVPDPALLSTETAKTLLWRI